VNLSAIDTKLSATVVNCRGVSVSWSTNTNIHQRGIYNSMAHESVSN